jgi:NADH-quinone oxidoreductase subunit J
VTLELILFYAFSAVLVGAAIGVITVRNPVHAALLLVLTFFTTSALWLLARAEFLGIALVLVYVGAVMVLFLFVVMMLDIKVAPMREGFIRYLPVGIGVGVIMLAEMLALIGWRSKLATAAPADPAATANQSNVEYLGHVLFTDYILPFEIAAVILTVAIIAAIALTLRHRTGVRVQDPSRQVLVRREDRVRIVKMAAEAKEVSP